MKSLGIFVAIKEPAALFDASQTDNGEIHVCPHGGGFAKTLREAEFRAHFREATESDLRDPWQPGMFVCGDAREFAGWYQPRNRWNGWAVPVFSEEVAREIAEHYNAAEGAGKLVYVDGADKYLWHPDPEDIDDDPFEFEGSTVVIDGKPRKVFAIGGAIWTWETVEPRT